MDGYTFLTLVLAACCAPLVAMVMIDWVWDMKEDEILEHFPRD